MHLSNYLGQCGMQFLRISDTGFNFITAERFNFWFLTMLHHKKLEKLSEFRTIWTRFWRIYFMLFIHQCIHLFIDSFHHWFISSFHHWFISSFHHWFIDSLIHSLVRSFIRLFVQLYIYQCIYLDRREGLPFPHINLRFVFCPSLRLSHFFVFKDRIPRALRSRVVYRFKCQRCSSLYVGQTSRLLHTRISEHLGISALTGKKRVNPPPTSILSHHCDTGHPVSPDDFTILSSSLFNSELLVRESLLIRKLNPSLDTNMGSFPFSLFWFLVSWHFHYISVCCFLLSFPLPFLRQYLANAYHVT